MNTIWSDFIQGIDTLYLSRSLRFADRYKDKYKKVFKIDDNSRILEIGCGPGALTEAISRWYKNAKITGIDRDSSFISYAREKSSDITYIEADATALPFPDRSFDVVISNTVSEHIEPSKFFSEQYRILRSGGICILLSARKGITINADFIDDDGEFEKTLWQKVEPFRADILRKHKIGRYAMNESELPATMEKHGFSNVSSEYLTINLTPDNPENDSEMAHLMINSHRKSSLDAAESLRYIASETVTGREIDQLKAIINEKYDRRISLYDNGQKCWDTSLSLTMVLRGIKP